MGCFSSALQFPLGETGSQSVEELLGSDNALTG
jgi:hypothetical protein